MIGLDSYSRQIFIYLDPILIYISLWIDCLFEIRKIAVFPLAFIAGWLQGHWWGFISRNYVVWPTFLLMNVFIALKGSHFWFLLEIQEQSMLYKLSPIQKHQVQIWPCHKNGQGQPRVIIWKKSPRAWAHNHLVQVKAFIISSSKTIPFASILYDILFYFMHVYKAPGQEETTLRTMFLMQAERSYHFDHWLHVSKNSSALWFYAFFHDFIDAHSPWAGADNPLGPKFLFQQEGFITMVICCNFRKNLFNLWRLFTSFHDYIHVYSRRSEADNPRGQNVDVNRNLLSLRSFATSLKQMSLKSDFIPYFSWFYTCIQPRGRGW